MKEYVENINGRSYTIDDIKNIFIDYTIRHGGNISERAKNVTVTFYKEKLPNGSRALANSSALGNCIDMLEGASIITFFNEYKHIADSWMDDNGNWHSNWEYEDEYTEHMKYSDYKNKVIYINRGIKGLAMGEAVAELFASKIYWELCGYSQSSIESTRRRHFYDEQIVTLKK